MDDAMSDVQPWTETLSSQCSVKCDKHCKRQHVFEKEKNPYKSYFENLKTHSTSSESEDHFSEEERQAFNTRVDSVFRNKAFLNYVELTHALKSGIPYLSRWNGKVVKVLVYPGAKVEKDHDLFVMNLTKEDAYIHDHVVEQSSFFDSPVVSESVKSKEDTVTTSSRAAATKVTSNFCQLSVSESVKPKAEENTTVISSKANGGRETFYSSKVFDDAGGGSNPSSGKEYGVTDRPERVSKLAFPALSGEDNTVHMTNSGANINGTPEISNGSYLHKHVSQVTLLVPEKESEVKISAPKRWVNGEETELNLSSPKDDNIATATQTSDLEVYDKRPYVVKVSCFYDVTKVLVSEGMEVKKSVCL